MVGFTLASLVVDRSTFRVTWNKIIISVIIFNEYGVNISLHIYCKANYRVLGKVR